jgi:hypothetical protein
MTASFGLSLDPWGRLVLIDAEGRRYVGVEPVRAFPVSDPSRGIALCSTEGHELLWIEDEANLLPATRAILEEELARREFSPVIQRILAVSSETTPAEWEVWTDRGPTRFTLGAEEDVRRLGEHRVLITDSRGIRYQVPDTRSLEATSRRLLERYL